MDGLLHISNLGRGRVDKVEDVVNRGDTVDVTVVEVDKARGRIGLRIVGMEDATAASPTARPATAASRRTPGPSGAPRAAAAGCAPRTDRAAWPRRRSSAPPPGGSGSSRSPSRACARWPSASGSASARASSGPSEAGISHFLEHMLFKGTPTLLGRGDRPGLRRPRRRGQRGHRARTTRCSTPGCSTSSSTGRCPSSPTCSSGPASSTSTRSARWSSRRSRCTRTTPRTRSTTWQHEAVFPDQALGRPVIGTAEVDRRRARATACAPTTATTTRRPNMVVAAAGNVAHERAGGALRAAARAACRPATGEGAFEPAHARARPTLVVKEKATEQYHLCLGGPGPVPQRPAPPRAVGARHGARRLDEQPALPGGAREARPGLLGGHVHRRLRRHRPGGRLPGHARGQPADGLRGHRHRAAPHGRGAAPGRRAAPGQGPPQGAPGAQPGELRARA